MLVSLRRVSPFAEHRLTHFEGVPSEGPSNSSERPSTSAHETAPTPATGRRGKHQERLTKEKQERKQDLEKAERSLVGSNPTEESKQEKPSSGTRAKDNGSSPDGSTAPKRETRGHEFRPASDTEANERYRDLTPAMKMRVEMSSFLTRLFGTLSSSADAKSSSIKTQFSEIPCSPGGYVVLCLNRIEAGDHSRDFDAERQLQTAYQQMSGLGRLCFRVWFRNLCFVHAQMDGLDLSAIPDALWP